MAKYSMYEEKTPHEKALDDLKRRFRKDGFTARKSDMVVMDTPCKKCGYLGTLINITYRNDNKRRVLIACTHCGHESQPEEITQGKLF